MNAVAHPDARPELYRPGAGAVLASTWRVGTPERQRAAVEAIRTTWESREWPDLGLLSYSVFVGADGDTLLHYSQWTTEQAYEDFVRTYRDDRNAEIDAAVPGIERVELHRYAPPYRSAAADGNGSTGPHVHVSTDGTRVLDFAAWESEQAHVEWRAESAPPGRVRRYTPALRLGAGV
ncbi:antibiotic biosynthesis monooxygenase [Streptomyces sp. SBC-4]|nr:antibiotic biosynthesis monooxygenase [Streptomyces sp. SBC-4]MDV5144817.1 antibiotic biosynthesis monooxygenase [Streptomyces sp. SBC-4]